MADSVHLGWAWEYAFLSSFLGATDATDLREHSENNWTDNHYIHVSFSPITILDHPCWIYLESPLEMDKETAWGGFLMKFIAQIHKIVWKILCNSD